MHISLLSRLIIVYISLHVCTEIQLAIHSQHDPYVYEINRLWEIIFELDEDLHRNLMYASTELEIAVWGVANGKCERT